MKQPILFSTMLFLSMIQSSDPAITLGAVREKWINYGNSLVADERDKFLDLYGLDIGYLDDSEIIKLFKSNSDQKTESLVLKYASSDYKPADTNLDAIQGIAAGVFGEHSNFKILHDSEYELDDICGFKHYASDTYYIALNCEKYLENLVQLEDILRHEYSHILHEDNINEEIMQYVAWSNSTVERTEIEKQTLPYRKAFETRADIYAAVNSPSYGKNLIELFKRPSAKGEVPTHPKTSDRIALLETIKLELDLATAKEA